MKQVILGTAGHIDHGKTSLIRALTGIDTDRLKEEKLRGITIELGFAHMDLPDGERLGIVDVPGHERFVKHMVAGATGIDLVALVIAADEGVMPQTREHLEICELLQVKKGLVVLTKTDLVDDPDWLEMVQEDVTDFLKGTFLEGSPIMRVSAATGEGIEELKLKLTKLVLEVEQRSADGPFRMPVDRVFSMRGFGTVVTGTSAAGTLRIGDAVIVYPRLYKTKVRGLQVHSEDVQEIHAGQRTAVNLQAVERAVIQRGDVVATPGALVPTYFVDVRLELLSSSPRPLKNRAKIRFHTGTAEHLAIAVLLDREELAPGAQAFAQVRLDQPVTALRGDRFVMRSYSPVMTIGGGTILHPLPRKHKGHGKRDAAVALDTLLHGDENEIILWHVLDAAWFGLAVDELQVRTNIPRGPLEKALQRFASQRKVVVFDRENQRFIHSNVLEDIQQAVLETLAAYHQIYPLKTGMSKEELAAQLPHPIDVKLYNYVLRQLVDRDRIVTEMEWVRLKSHKIDLSGDEEGIRRQIELAFRESGLQPPFFKDVATALPGTPRQHQDVLEWMVSQGILTKVKEDIYFHTAAIQDLRQRLTAFLRENGEISTPQFKDMTQASRKYTIPLLEYFDTQRVTIRIGDTRRLRESRSG